jgi:hypothetical protein
MATPKTISNAAIKDSIDRMVVEMTQKLDDYEKVIDIRFSHVDLLIGQQREDLKGGLSEIIRAVEQIVAAHVAGIEQKVDHQNERIESVKNCVDDEKAETEKRFEQVNAAIKDHSIRIFNLEAAPAKADAGKWRAVADKVLWSFVGLLLAGAAAAVWPIIAPLFKGVTP